MDLQFSRDILKPVLKYSAVILGVTTILNLVILGPLFVVGGIVLYVVGSQGGFDGHNYSADGGNTTSTNRLLVIPFRGEIDGQPADADSADPSLVYGYSVADELAKAESDATVKAVVLSMDSPGGTIYGARAVADAVAHYRAKTHRPVITYVAGAADSGAYWAAVSTDVIVADYGTDVGSIGVISGPYRSYKNVTSLNDPLDGQVVAGAITSTNITAGFGKDEGDTYRDLTATEKANLQLGVNNEYDEFVKFVAERRHLTADTIRTKIGALSYDPKTALGLGLIDSIGGREAAYSQAANRAGLKDGDYRIVSPPGPKASPASDDNTFDSSGDDSGATACRLHGLLAISAASKCYNK